MKIKITGTKEELNDLYSWAVLAKLIKVDYYKMHLIPGDEVFTITEQDFYRAGLLTQPTDSIDESE